MLSILRALVSGCFAFFTTQAISAARIAALEQQLANYKRITARPRIKNIDRIFWVALYRWSAGRWRDSIS